MYCGRYLPSTYRNSHPNVPPIRYLSGTATSLPSPGRETLRNYRTRRLSALSRRRRRTPRPERHTPGTPRVESSVPLCVTEIRWVIGSHDATPIALATRMTGVFNRYHTSLVRAPRRSSPAVRWSASGAGRPPDLVTRASEFDPSSPNRRRSR